MCRVYEGLRELYFDSENSPKRRNLTIHKIFPNTSSSFAPKALRYKILLIFNGQRLLFEYREVALLNVPLNVRFVHFDFAKLVSIDRPTFEIYVSCFVKL
jgi:hypothetical protein